MNTFTKTVIPPILKKIACEYDGEHLPICLDAETPPEEGNEKHYYTLVNDAREGILVQWTVKCLGGRYRLVCIWVVESDRRGCGSRPRKVPDGSNSNYW